MTSEDEEAGYRMIRQCPPNDGGISLGQAAVAGERMRRSAL